MVKFTPKEKRAGDHIRADDWNAMQREIKNDLLEIEEMVRVVEHRKSVHVARGIASHDIYVPLEWETEPHVHVSFVRALDETGEGKRFRCYAREVSKSGFRVFGLSEDGASACITEWVAIAVK